MPINCLKFSEFEYQEGSENVRNCPSCGWRLKFISESYKRKIITLNNSIEVVTKRFCCNNEFCNFKGYMYDPDSIALPNIKYGKDIIKLLIIYKYDKNMSIKKTIQEINELYFINIPSSTAKRLIRHGEAIIISNLRTSIKKLLQEFEVISLNVDFMEPKSKKHKVAMVFLKQFSIPVLYYTLEHINNFDINTLIQIQAEYIRDKEFILSSDADTSLINHNIKSKKPVKHHLCSVHFFKIIFELGKTEDKEIMKLIKDLLSKIWTPYRTAENRSIISAFRNKIPVQSTKYSELFSDAINIVTESKSRNNTYYASMKAFHKLVKLHNAIDELDENKIGLPFLPIHKNSNEIVDIINQIGERVSVLENIIHIINNISTIFNDRSLTREESIKSIDKFFMINNPKQEYEEAMSKKVRKTKSSSSIQSFDTYFKAAKQKYLKYRDVILVLKDYDDFDFTNNTCEGRFSLFRGSERHRTGTKHHSENEYLNYIPFFHLTCDIPMNLTLKYLFTFSPVRFGEAKADHLKNLRIYHRFHNPEYHLDMILNEMKSEVYVR